MSFDWNQQQGQYENAPLIPEGRAWVRIKDIRHGSKNGGLFTTKAGEPKMLVTRSHQKAFLDITAKDRFLSSSRQRTLIA